MPDNGLHPHHRHAHEDIAVGLKRRLALAAVIAALTAVPIMVQTPPIGLVEGQAAPRTYRAPRTIQFVDENATRIQRAVAASSVPTATQRIEGVAQGAMKSVDSYFTSKATMLSDTQRALAREKARAIVSATLKRSILASEVAQVRAGISAPAVEGLSTRARSIVRDAARSAIRPTVVVDVDATREARIEAWNAVPTAVVSFIEGENIVEQGEIVRPAHLETIRRLGLLGESRSFLSVEAMAALMALVVLSAGAYLRVYDRQRYRRFKDLLLLGTLFVSMVWITRTVIWFLPDISPYVLPVPLAAMLAALLLDSRDGLLMALLTTIAALLLGFTSGSTVVATLAWSLIAVIAVAFMRDRRQLVFAGFLIVASGVTTAALATLASGVPMDAVVEAAGWAIIGGGLSAVSSYGLLPFFEQVFGITTDVRLIELASPAHPLMRQLMTHAPGTYTHSVAVANLAEAAAESIGANPLLARVGAYYHDIGKVRRPEFFFENQIAGDNPHDAQEPRVSAEIIRSHVEDGLEMADRHGIPFEVREIIARHHGTTLVTYFFHKAHERDGQVFESDFRYQGGRPRSPEAALVMLADASEAAVRALHGPTDVMIAERVRAVVNGKLEDRQLDEAHLTLADIERAVRVFTRILSGMYHPRLAYPDIRNKRSDSADHPHHEPS